MPCRAPVWTGLRLQDTRSARGKVDTEALRNAPIRSEFEKVRANYARKVMVEGKGFVGPTLHFLKVLCGTGLQIVAERCR
jgi:hypothetical protein